MLRSNNQTTKHISRRKLLLAAIALTAIFSGGTCSMAAGEFRQIAIPARDNGYSSFTSQAINTKSAYDFFLKTLNSGDNFGNKEAVISKLKEAKIDFASESLVLLCHSEGSGSTQVTFNQPKVVDGKLTCSLERKVAQMGTADMAYYCYALVVKRSAVKDVVFNNGKRTETISTGG